MPPTLTLGRSFGYRHLAGCGLTPSGWGYSAQMRCSAGMVLCRGNAVPCQLGLLLGWDRPCWWLKTSAARCAASLVAPHCFCLGPGFSVTVSELEY